MAKSRDTQSVAPAATPPSTAEQITSLQFQLDESKAALEAANRTKAVLEQRASQAPLRGVLDPESLKHPNAFMAQDGRTYYKYVQDGETVVTAKPIEEMSLEDYERMPIQFYDNQPGRIPNNLTVVFKDPQWAGHWANKKANDAARVWMLRQIGFVPAKIEDLSFYYKGLNDQDGALEQHDLVLMKIHKAKLYSKFAEWMHKAKFRQGIDAYKSEASDYLRTRTGRDGGNKVSFYHTPQALSEPVGIGPAPNEGR